MRIVITGALGHIGSQMIRDLARSFPGTDLTLIDNLLTQRYCSLFALPEGVKARFVEADVLQCDLGNLFTGADVVLHLAAITNAEASFENRGVVEHVNYNATARVADACAAAGCRMIHLSSTSVYGTQEAVVDEECDVKDLQPQSPYAETKLKEEAYVQKLARDGRLRVVVCRFGTICGVSAGMRFHTAVNKFCWQASMGQPLTVWRTALHQRRPYLTLSDATRAVAHIVSRDLFDGQIYNILTDNLTVNDIICSIRERIPGLVIRPVDTPIMNQLSYEVSNDRFRRTGFEFSGSIRKCIDDTVELLKGASGGLSGC